MDKENKLFTLIGPPEAGKMALAEALAQAFGDRIELMPRLTDKPSENVVRSDGSLKYVTPVTLRRHLQDGRLILTRENAHRSGFDRARLDRLLQKKHVVLVTNEEGVRELRSQRDEAGQPKYDLVIIRVVQPRKNDEDPQPSRSDLDADIEILSGVGPDPTDWAVRELSRHFNRLLA